MSGARSERGFTLTRILPGTRQSVFAAWTQPEHLAWFFNPSMPTPTDPIEVDLRVGGTWRQQMVVDEDLQYPTGGVYLEIVTDERLVFRWGAVGGWPELAADQSRDAPVVTVSLSNIDDGTLLDLHVGFPDHLPDEEVRRLVEGGTRAGWGATIDRVADSTAVTSQPVA